MFMAEGKASERFRPTISTYLKQNNLIDWLNAKYPGEAFWNQREGTRTHVEYLQHIVKKRIRILG